MGITEHKYVVSKVGQLNIFADGVIAKRGVQVRKRDDVITDTPMLLSHHR